MNNMTPTDKQRHMAVMLGLCPDAPDSWPMSLIDRLIWLKENRPRIDFDLEFRAGIRRSCR